MYVSINHEYVELSAAAVMLSITEQELITAGHTVDNVGDVTAINYANHTEPFHAEDQRNIGAIFTEVIEDLQWERDYLSQNYYY